jgi:hypothetical protein
MKFALAPSHQLAAEIIYYTDEKIFVQTDEKATRLSQFQLWPWPAELKGKDGFYVWDEDGAVGPYGEYFAATTGIKTLAIYRGGVPVRTYHIVPGQNSLIPPFPGNPKDPYPAYR